MLVILFLGLLIGCSAHSKSELTSANRVPDACDDCQSVVDRFIDAAKDPYKVEQLKSMLRVGCDHTPYPMECKALVKNLQTVVNKVQPYIKSTRSICRKVKLCDAGEGWHVSRLLLLAVRQHLGHIDGQKEDVCAECQVAVKGMSQTVDKEHRIAFRKYVRKLCRALGRHAEKCNAVADELIPVFINHVTETLKSEDACPSMGLCKSHSIPTARKPSSKPHFSVVKSMLEKSPQIKTRIGHTRMTCIECQLLVDVVLAELQSNNSIQGLAKDISDDACPKLPESFGPGCIDFLGLYAPTVVYLTVHQLDTDGMCQAFMHVCGKEELALQSKLSTPEMDGMKCEACKGVQKYANKALQEPDLQNDLVAGMNSYVCASFPGTFQALCENMVQRFVPSLLRKVIDVTEDEYFCTKRIHAC